MQSHELLVIFARCEHSFGHSGAQLLPKSKTVKERRLFTTNHPGLQCSFYFTRIIQNQSRDTKCSCKQDARCSPSMDGMALKPPCFLFVRCFPCGSSALPPWARPRRAGRQRTETSSGSRHDSICCWGCRCLALILDCSESCPCSWAAWRQPRRCCWESWLAGLLHIEEAHGIIGRGGFIGAWRHGTAAVPSPGI
jgi:hypothetical protein